MESNEPDNNPIDPEIIPPADDAEEDNSSDYIKNKLETLPVEVKEELEKRLQGGESIKAVREDMINKYPAIENLKAKYKTWLRKASELRGDKNLTQDEKLVREDIGSALPTTEDLQKAVSTVINPTVSLDRKQEAMSMLFAKVMERLSILENKNKNFINPDYEALMVTYMKAASDLIERVSKLQSVLNKDIEADMLKRQDEMIRNMFTVTYQAYNLTHADEETNRFDLFRSKLEDLITAYLQNYSQNTANN